MPPLCFAYYCSGHDLEASSQSDHLTLSTPKNNFTALVPDIPVPSSEIDPLVAQIHEGYRCADLLLLLPGCIPIPSFSIYPPLPAPSWVDPYTNSFTSDIIDSLSQHPPPHGLHPSLSLQTSPSSPSRCNSFRSVIAAPLIVRPPSTTLSPYTPEGRAYLLSTIGVPPEYHDHTHTKVLIVSFGGQIFRAPSRSSSRSQSRSTTPSSPSPTIPPSPPSPFIADMSVVSPLATYQSLAPCTGTPLSPIISSPPRLATPHHIWIPGAPPTSKPHTTPTPSTFDIPELATIPPTPDPLQMSFDVTPPPRLDEEDLFDARLLPDESWIAIVCGASTDKWSEEDKTAGLPEGFYVAPRDVYMPDLTAVGDVLLGKLHGLRLLLDREGVGVELSRQSYEAGDWALAVEDAWARGKAAKCRKRADAWAGKGMDTKQKQGLDMARMVVSWTQDWWTRSGLRN
ncbi:hypothetical protein H0H87_003702 [Tephrocybe sp. NHM501043]|nr:hypothetical protein H0H87_003702 [Tephrocybe sp. NHM501043]